MSKLKSAGARRFVALASVAGVAAAGAAAVLTSGNAGAGADPISKTFKYDCVFPLVGTQELDVTVNTDIPKTIAVGASTGRIQISAPTVVNATTVDGLNTILATSISGTATASASITSPDGSLPLGVKMTFPATPVPESGPMTVVATGSTVPLTFQHPGTLTVFMGDLTLAVVATKADGSIIPKDQIDLSAVPCTLQAGVDKVLATATVTGPTPTGTGPTPVPTATPAPTATPVGPTPVPTMTPMPTMTPAPTATPAPPTATPVPTSTPVSTPTPISTGANIPYKFDLKGTTHIAPANGDAPLVGGVNVIFNTSTKAFSGSLTLNDTVGQMNVLGFLPVTVGIGFTQVGPTTGTLAGGVLTTNSNMYVKYAYFNVFGWAPIGGGPLCQTTTAMNVVLKSTQAAFNPLVGGPIAGGYVLPPINDQCGGLQTFISWFAVGGGNTIAANLTIPGATAAIKK